MSKILNPFGVLILFLVCSICDAQTLHKMSEDLPQINKEFQLHVYVTVDESRQANFTPVELEEPITMANTFFSPIGVSFKLCAWEEVPDYNLDNLDLDEINEFDEMRVLHFDKNRINIYIHNDIGGLTLCGFAELSGIANEEQGTFIALKKECPGALAHELGHIFGLLHTFEGNGSELVDGSNCETEGDGICDTPADPYILDNPTVWQDGCEFIFTGLDANGQFYQPDMGNVMSYYNCDCGFTFGQYLKMANTYLESTRKIW